MFRWMGAVDGWLFLSQVTSYRIWEVPTPTEVVDFLLQKLSGRFRNGSRNRWLEHETTSMGGEPALLTLLITDFFSLFVFCLFSIVFEKKEKYALS